MLTISLCSLKSTNTQHTTWVIPHPQGWQWCGALTWNRSYMWPGPSCDTGTPCPPPAAQRQSVISVRKRTWAAPAGRQRSPRWPACAHWDPTWLHPMNRAPVLKSHTAGRAGLKPTRRKKNYSSKDKQEGGRGGQLFNTSTGPSGGVQLLCGKMFFCWRWVERGDECHSQESRGRGPGWGRGRFPLEDLSVVWGHAVRHWGPEVEGEHDNCRDTATSVLVWKTQEQNKKRNHESRIPRNFQ